MITTLGKVLAVATAVFSILALGVVLVAATGGPNWMAESRMLPDYEFTRNDGPPVTWTAKTRTARLGQDNTLAVRTPANAVAVLPDAIVKARQDLKNDQQDELNALNRDIPLQTSRIADATALIEKDLAAMQKRNTDLIAALDQQAKDVDTVSKEAVTISESAQAVQAVRDARRDDVFRLRNELASLRTDTFRLKEQRLKLADLLVRVKGNNDRLQRREQQLLASGAVDPDKDYDDGAANAPAKEAAAPQPPKGNDPDAAKPDDKPEEKTPEETKPKESKPEENKPEDKTPADSPRPE